MQSDRIIFRPTAKLIHILVMLDDVYGDPFTKKEEYLVHAIVQAEEHPVDWIDISKRLIKYDYKTYEVPSTMSINISEDYKDRIMKLKEVASVKLGVNVRMPYFITALLFNLYTVKRPTQNLNNKNNTDESLYYMRLFCDILASDDAEAKERVKNLLNDWKEENGNG